MRVTFIHAWKLKRAPRWYFTHYSFVIIILFSTHLLRSAFSVYSFGKPIYGFSRVFMFSVCSVFRIQCLLFRLYHIWVIIIYINYGFGGREHGFNGIDGLDGFSGFSGFGRFERFGGFNGFCGFKFS